VKRSEIKVGEAYYYDRSANRETSGYGGASKAVVVDGERYTLNRDTWRRRSEPDYRQDPKGTAVLVDIYYEGVAGAVGQIVREAVPSAHLRGPYEETKAAIEAGRAKRREREEAASTARKDAHAAAEAIRDRAQAVGLRVSFTGGYGASRVEVTMSPETAAKLLDVYEKHGREA
jgi:hypothetical protein